MQNGSKGGQDKEHYPFPSIDEQGDQIGPLVFSDLSDFVEIEIVIPRWGPIAGVSCH